MKLILRYFRKYWLFAVSAPLMMFLEVFMDLMLPALMARIVDEGVASGDLNLVLRLGLRMILFTALAFVGGGGCSVLASKAATGLGADLRHDLFGKVLSFSHKNLDKLETGNLIIRLTNDVNQIEETSMMMLRIMVRAPLQIMGSLIMAVVISRRLSLLFSVFVPLLLIVVFLIIRKAYPLFYKVQSRLDRLNTRLQENLAGKRLVKAFVREDYETQKFDEANDDLVDTTVRANRTVAFMNPAMQIILNGGIIGALWFGAGLVDGGALKIGALIAFINYLRQLLFSLMMFSQLIMRFSRAQASAVRIGEVLDTEPDVDDREGGLLTERPKGRLEFRNVTFSYGEEDPVLKDISFVAEAGETLAVIGATGSGKSTLTHLISRFYHIDSGQILLDGRDISEIEPRELRKQIALVPQQTLLFSGTVEENILFHYGAEERVAKRELMEQTAAFADISSFLDSLPEGYDTDVNQRGVNLSGGQKQRIAIARALAKEAPLVILDDATSAVDTATEGRIRRTIKEGKGSRTTLIVAQRISSVMDADKIIVLDDGQINGMGSHEELLNNNDIYREIFRSQLDEEAV